MPYQVIYASVSSTPLQQDALQALLAQAQRNNGRAGITGALVYVDGCFLQVLEGPAPAVQALMARIGSDLRHEAMSVLQAADVAAAAFPDWQMAYVGATAAQVAQWAGLSTRTELPDTLAALRLEQQRAMQVTRSIVAVLLQGPAPAGPAG